MADNRISMPSGFGGLMRYGEEYDSFLHFSPTQVMIFIVVIIAIRIGLSLFLKV